MKPLPDREASNEAALPVDRFLALPVVRDSRRLMLLCGGILVLAGITGSLLNRSPSGSGLPLQWIPPGFLLGAGGCCALATLICAFKLQGGVFRNLGGPMLIWGVACVLAIILGSKALLYWNLAMLVMWVVASQIGAWLSHSIRAAGRRRGHHG